MAEDQDGGGGASPRRKSGIPENMRAVGDIPVSVRTVLGTATIQVNKMLRLNPGTVVEIDRRIGEAIDVYANDQLVARGELVVGEDGRLSVTMTEIMKSKMSEI